MPKSDALRCADESSYQNVAAARLHVFACKHSAILKGVGMYRSKAWARLTIPLVITGSLVVGGAAQAGPSAAAPQTALTTTEQGARAASPSQLAAGEGGDERDEIMLANYPGGHTIDKEIREETPRADEIGRASCREREARSV